MITDEKKIFLESLPDVDLFEETARRLKRRYRDEHGVFLCFGSYEFVFEDGVFDGIDECNRTMTYQSARRLQLIGKD